MRKQLTKKIRKFDNKIFCGRRIYREVILSHLHIIALTTFVHSISPNLKRDYIYIFDRPLNNPSIIANCVRDKVA